MTTPTEDDLPVLVTTGEAALLAHVEPVTIRVWRSRERLRPVGRTADRRLLFDLADVIRLDRGDTADRPGS